MDFIFNVVPGDVVYDIETYPNVFTFTARHTATDEVWYFEISSQRNDLEMFCLFLDVLAHHECRMVGFNNIGFDYPVIHHIYKCQHAFISAPDIYTKAMSIIKGDFSNRFTNMVWESDWIVPQVDLYKIHHFDNVSRATSLKVLEFNMRSDSIEDLPFDVGLDLDSDQVTTLAKYNLHDVNETLKFYHKSKDMIKFREKLSTSYGKNFINHNDTKIGKDYFIMKLEQHTPGCCYKRIDGKRKTVQTLRESINLAEVILYYVQFEQPEFNRILNWFRSQVITDTKGSITDINCTVNGFKFDFGTGGIHGSVESQIISSNDDYCIEDWDVASYYPNLAITNGLHPAHLGKTFCEIYKDVYEQRKQHAKGTTENAMLKLALNGVYGDSNNKYSPFFDPHYTMSITINGQLLLCMLAEQLMKLDGLTMVQINTDGLTIRYPRIHKNWVHEVAQWWEGITNLELEHAEYSRMFIRDVNNYIAEGTDGKIKRRGAYEYQLGWHQNHSALIVPMVAEACLTHGDDIRESIMSHENIMDFMLRAKVPRSSYLEFGGERVQNIVRYYISTDGDILEKVMQPAGPVGEYKRANKLTDEYYNAVMEEAGDQWDERIHTKNKSKYEERRSGINTGWTVRLCNNMDDVSDTPDINFEWYIKEVEKLVNPLL